MIGDRKEMINQEFLNHNICQIAKNLDSRYDVMLKVHLSSHTVVALRVYCVVSSMRQVALRNTQLGVHVV